MLAAHLFDSPVQPTAKPSATVKPTRTPRATATPDLGAFISPLSTPTPFARAPLALNARVYLPLVRRDPTPIKYGWKGMTHPWQAEWLCQGPCKDPAGNNFWGIKADWWYNWLHNEANTANAMSAASTLAMLEAKLPYPDYVPMVWCMADVGAGPTPSQVAELARRYPGRAWLIFNEADHYDHSGQCGENIFGKYPSYYTSSNWQGLGQYLAQQYLQYRNAIKAADPTARVFAPACLQLPMPTLQGLEWGDRSIGIWNGFLDGLGGALLDGIAVHAYPSNPSTRHTGCAGFLDPPCAQRALGDAYRFFQGTDGSPSRNHHPAYTRNTSIWITEIGVLDNAISWVQTRDGFEQPMLTWFQNNVATGQPREWINTVAWYTTYDSSNISTNVFDATRPGTLTAVGERWKAAACDGCACPGPDCP